MTLKELLKTRDMTGARLSRVIGVPEWTVFRWINGNSYPKNSSTLFNIAKALDVTVETVVKSLNETEKDNVGKTKNHA